jgi:hypothetical protein
VVSGSGAPRPVGGRGSRETPSGPQLTRVSPPVEERPGA